MGTAEKLILKILLPSDDGYNSIRELSYQWLLSLMTACIFIAGKIF